jgi:hypothetical protein
MANKPPLVFLNGVPIMRIAPPPMSDADKAKSGEGRVFLSFWSLIMKLLAPWWLCACVDSINV